MDLEHKSVLTTISGDSHVAPDVAQSFDSAARCDAACARCRSRLDAIAEALVQSFRPRRVFATGDSAGLLVEVMWDRDIETCGRVGAPADIAQVRDGLRSYCAAGSLSDRIEGSFDLITCIGVRETLSERTAIAAVAVMTAASDRIVFSAPSIGHCAAAPIAGKPTAYWLRLFAERSFAPLMGYDASFVTPQCMVFERAGQTPPDDLLSGSATLARLREERVAREEVRQSLVARVAVEQEAGDVLRTQREALHTSVLNLQRELRQTEHVRLAAAAQREVARHRTLAARDEQFGATLLSAALARYSDELRDQITAHDAAAPTSTVRAHAATQAGDVRPRRAADSREVAKLFVRRAVALVRRIKRTASRGSVVSQHSLPAPHTNGARPLGALVGRLDGDAASNGSTSAAKYLEIYPDVARAAFEPWEHFVRHGKAEGREWPSAAKTEADWYLAFNPDVAATGIDPWEHYLAHGKDDNRVWPFALTSIADPTANSQAVDYRLALDSGLFDRDWYLRENPDVAHIGGDPLRHYLLFGGLEGRSPSRRFDSCWYNRLYPDAAAAGTNPLLHYLGYSDSHTRALMWQAFDERAQRIQSVAEPDSTEREKGGVAGALHSTNERAVRATPNIREAILVSPCEVIRLARAIAKESFYAGISSALDDPRTLDRLETRKKIQALQRHPKISIVMPVYNTDLRWLSLAIESVRAQIYENWELCIVDDCSSDGAVRDTIRDYAARDKRINVHFRSANGHIATASNNGLQLATGEYIGFLDHDDELTPDALAKVALAIGEHTNPDFLYSDEDKIDATGLTYGRAYKPAWSPEFILACGYTTHFSVYSASILRRVGGFRNGLDGAQDYDLTLRVSEITNRIVHIPDVLYHWRAIGTSTAAAGDAKSYALGCARRAMQDHMRRRGIAGEPTAAALAGYTGFAIAVHGSPRVSIVIPTAGKTVEINGRAVNLIENCIESIRTRSTYDNYEIIVMENGNLSTATTQRLLDHDVRLERYAEPSFNLAQKMNFGSDRASGEYLVVLNDDTEVISPDWIEQLLQYCQLDGVGAVGAKLLFPDATIQHIGVMVVGGSPGHAMYGDDRNAIGHLGLATTAHNAVAVTGACLMTKARLFAQVGGFDHRFDLNYNDVDYCLTIRELGYRIVVNPLCELYHYESVSRAGARGTVRHDELDTFYKRWGERYDRELFLRA